VTNRIRCAWGASPRGLVLAAMLLLGPAGARAEPVVLKLAPMMPGKKPAREWRACAADIRRRTEERVRVEWVAPTGDAVGSATKVGPTLVYGLPLCFRSFAEVDHVRAELDEHVGARLATNGLVVLGFEESGFAYILSGKPIRTPADLDNARVWVPAGAGRNSGTENHPLGIKAVPLKIGNVRGALKRGDVDAVVFPPLGAIVLRWHTGLRYVLDTPFAYLSNPIVIESPVFSALSAADRQSVRQSVRICLQEVSQKARTKHGEALDVLRMQGVDFIVPATEERARWNAWAADATGRLVETGKIDRATVGLLDKALAEYRARAATGPKAE